MECGRKCSHCGQNGHSSRTCGKAAGIMLFGVQIGCESNMRNSKSHEDLEACNRENAAGESSGYTSHGHALQSSKSHRRKKGKPWSEEEHKSFLAGLEKLGKGEWKGIATNFVPTRNSTQIASHAQKYFIRLSAIEKKNRRASVFDITLREKNEPSIPGSQSRTAAAEGSQQSTSLCASGGKPPLSPIKGCDFRGWLYSPRSLPAHAVTPTFFWVPVVNFSGQSTVYVPNIHGTLATCAAVAPQPSTVAAFGQPLQQKGSSQAGSVPPRSNHEELNVNIRNLTL